MDPAIARQFAVEVVQQLRTAGYEALWAGGCVRDMLVGREPKDYDVATSALPDQVREVFGRKRTIPIGASFGVITVLGKRKQGQIEVATFRCDADYSDGRHPDSVSFSTAEEDAQRRDFTINGLFYDPIASEVIDYVGGKADLAAKIVRAIRDPFERIAEDKLRMLRAVRFAATFQFALDAETKAAVQQQASQISIVSAERVAAEMRRMLVNEHRAGAMQLLRDCNLLTEILPEASSFYTDEEAWDETMRVLRQLHDPPFPVAFAALTRLLFDRSDVKAVTKIAKRWKLSNEESHLASFVVAHEELIRNADTQPWPKLQRILINDDIESLMQYASAIASVHDDRPAALALCRDKLALPREQLDPPLLFDGNDLSEISPPGPAFKTILMEVRDAQLREEITTKEQAEALARTLIGE